MKKKRRAVLLDLLILVLAIGMGWFLVTELPRLLPDTVITSSQQTPAPVGQSQSYDTMVRPGRLPGYENTPGNQTPEYFCYLYNSNMSASAGTPCNVLLENTAGNTCDMIVTLTTQEDREIYCSPVICPGEYLMYGTLSSLPEAGEYTVCIAIQVFEAGHALPTEKPLAIYHETAALTVL